MSSTYKFVVVAPREVILPERGKPCVDREQFYEWLWKRFSNSGLIGVHEGTLLSDEAAEQGFETDSWTVDSGEAPRERDWVSQQKEAQAELYFATQEEAQKAIQFLMANFQIQIGKLEEQVPEDWDAQWKASFLNAGAGVPIPPYWRVVPPWVGPEKADASQAHEKWIKINPGAGFGTGTHETTQLCLQALGEFTSGVSLERNACLDFGSGSGILSIGLAILGAKVDAVEIDPLAIDNAKENASLNQVEGQICFAQNLESGKKYQVVIANILKPVLLEFAERLISSLSPQGLLILSGLIEKDVAPVVEAYSKLLDMPAKRVYERGEWRAVVFKK